MPTFFATARDSDGRAVQRQIEAINRAQALAQLRGLGLTSVRLREQLPTQGRDTQARPSFLRRPSLSSLTHAARQASPSDSDPYATLEVEITALPPPDDGNVPTENGATAPPLSVDRPPSEPSLAPEETVRPTPPAPTQVASTAVPPLPTPLPPPSTTVPRLPTPLPPPSTARPAAPKPSPPRSPVTTAAVKPAAPAATSASAPRGGPPSAPAAVTPSAAAKPAGPHPRLTAVDRLTFFSALANMVIVGIPLGRALSSLSEQFTDARARAVIDHISVQLRRGRSLSAAMSQMPDVFTRLQIGVVRGAEDSGRLAPALQRLYGYEERTLTLTRRIRSTLTYPLTVFACAIGLVMFVGRSLVTGMSPVMAQAKVELNLVTRAVMGFAKALDRPSLMLAFVATCAALAYVVVRYLRTPTGRERRDRVLMRTPLVASLLRRVETMRICEALAVLYGSGVPILRCLELTTETCDNVVARDALEATQRELAQGVGLAGGMGRSGFFDRTVVQMVAMGEETGRIGLALTKVAQYNDLEVQTALDQFAVAIEPLMFTVLGVVVGIIALVAFAPLYQLMEAMT